MFGHEVDQYGIYPNPQKTAAVTMFPVPENVVDFQSFFSLYSYYLRLIKNAAGIVKPLHSTIYP